jgi:transposase
MLGFNFVTGYRLPSFFLILPEVFTMYCGIDVAKGKSQACIMDEQKQVIAEFSFDHTQEGFVKLEKYLAPDTKIGMEATGSYSKGLHEYLRHKYNVCYVDSVQIFNFSRMHFLHVKNDKIDARLIAQYLMHGFKISTPIRTDSLKDLARLYSRIIRNRSRYKCMFESQLNVVFPELESKINLHKTNGLFPMLLKYPTPRQIATADPLALRESMIKSNKNRAVYTEEYVRELQALAANSIGVRDYPEECFVYTTKLILFYDDLVKEIKQKMQTIIDSTPYAKMNDEFGFNTAALALIIGEIGDIRRFPSHKKFVGYCGLDVRQKQSGKMVVSNLRITKRGSKILRNTFYNLVITHIRHKTDVGDFYLKMRAKGKHAKKAIVAAARKLAVKTYYDLQHCHDASAVTQ